MTLANLRTLTRAITPGATTGVIPSDNVLLDLILNKGVEEIAAYTACLPTNKKFNAVASQGDASDPYIISTVIGNYLTVGGGGLWWNQGSVASPQWKKLYPRTIEYLDENRTNWHEIADGTPEDYTIDGDNLYIVPAPVSSLTSGLWLFYSKTPGTMSDATHYAFSGSTTNLTHLSMFDFAIVYYARSKISPMLNKETGENLSYAEYIKERDEKFDLLKNNADFAQQARFQGPLVRP